VENRLTISLAGSTSSIGIAGRSPNLNSNRPRSDAACVARLSTFDVYFLNTSNCRDRVACWSRKTVSGLNRCSSPSRRHWYSPPTSSRRCARSASLAG
jgi:hypothetical protein